MTVAIAVVSADGLVLAADSRTTFGWGGGPVRVLSDYTHKVFKIDEKVGVACFGYAFLRRRNIAAHVEDFIRVKESDQPEALASEIYAYFSEEFAAHTQQFPNEAPPPDQAALGFLVVGYDENGVGHSYDVLIPGGPEARANHNTRDNPGASWRGQTDVIRRIIKGADLDLLQERAARAGLSAHVDALQELTTGLEYIVPFDAMNLQDAVDFAEFAISTTIATQRFIYGTMGQPGSWPGVGGPVEIGIVTPRDPFRFISQTDVRSGRWSPTTAELSSGPGEVDQ